MKMVQKFKARKLFLELYYDDRSVTKSNLLKFKKVFPLLLRELERELKTPKSLAQVHFSLSLIGDLKMRRINKLHRKKDKTTDVLSFPFHQELRNKKFNLEKELFLGDLLISLPVAKKQSRQFRISVEREICHLLTHGYLHLLGYDHERSLKEEKMMFRREEKYLKNTFVQFPKL